MAKRLIVMVLTIVAVAFLVRDHFPTAPTTATPVVQLVDDSAHIAWANYQGAYHYVVTLQSRPTSGDTWTINETSMTTPPLQPNTRYTICVTAIADVVSERRCVDFMTD